ncbi:MAG: 16S rRNA (cytosine(1402)-N(4))-methyltransferase RsmH [Fusobacteria bacterium]|nr:16S rRNA (cytosine(1402)-N(4))-methyltransferase RsmH [Fusobacteriota bacterium]
MEHISILLNEAVAGLDIKENGVYVDCTLGGGGHSLEILKKLNGSGLLIGIDQDDFAFEYSKKRLSNHSNIIFVKNNFSELENILDEYHIDKIDGILLDLGVSSFQFDDRNRGFSYWEENELDMRMDKSQTLTAKDIINKYSQERLIEIFTNYGEEKNSYKITKKIIAVRNEKEIATNQELIEIIKSALTEREKRKTGHPARKIFQALRIEVNDELGVLKRLLKSVENRLNTGGRLVVITFHSLEDRIVKQFINSKINPCICPPDFPECTCGLTSTYKKITKKPLFPSENEINNNPRARSAKLRIAERV